LIGNDSPSGEAGDGDGKRVEDRGIEPLGEVTPSATARTDRPPNRRKQNSRLTTTIQGAYAEPTMPREKKIPPIPFDFKEAVSRLLKVKPMPSKPKAKKAKRPKDA